MYRLSYGKRPLVESSQVISAGICVRNFLIDTERHDFDLSIEENVRWVVQEMRINTTFKLMQLVGGKQEYTKPNGVKLTYTKSNLGRGFIFWFLCNLCGRRVKNLYIPPSSEVPACRECHRLVYERQNDSKLVRGFRKFL